MTTSVVIPALRQKFSLRHDDDNNKGSTIRRGKCILLLSRTRTRTKAMVIQFKSLSDCLAFADRFVALNTAKLTSNTSASPTSPGNKESIITHLVRLSNEPYFRNLVQGIESTLEGSRDGMKLLQSWADHESSDDTE